MKRLFATLLIITTLFSLNLNAQEMNLHSFTVKDINGENFDLSQLKGKKVLVVNTASECGLTPQYETLEEVYQQYGGDDFVIIGFPANNFGGQEPGTNEEIKVTTTSITEDKASTLIDQLTSSVPELIQVAITTLLS